MHCYFVLSTDSTSFSASSIDVRKPKNNSPTFLRFFSYSSLEYNSTFAGIKHLAKFLTTKSLTFFQQRIL